MTITLLRCVRCGGDFAPLALHDGGWFTSGPLADGDVFTGNEHGACLKAPDRGPCESLPVPNTRYVREASTTHGRGCPRSHTSTDLDLLCTCGASPAHRRSPLASASTGALR